MSIRLTRAVYDNGPRQRHLHTMLLALADHADDTGLCWPGIARLAQHCRIQPRQAKRTIAALEDEGWIAVRRGSGRGHTNLYQLNVDRLLGRTSPEKGVMGDTHAREKVSSRAGETPGKGVMGDTRTTNPPDNHQENRQQSKRPRHARAARPRAALTDVDQAKEWLSEVHPVLTANRLTIPPARDAIAAGITPQQALELFDAAGHKTGSAPLVARLLGDLISREVDRRNREELERAERIQAQRARREAEAQLEPEPAELVDYPEHVADLSPRRRAEWLFSDEGRAWQAEHLTPEELAELEQGVG